MRRDGSFIPAYWWSSPVNLPQGRGVIYSFFDLTERRAREEATRERDIARVRAAEFQAAQRRIVESVDAVHRQTASDLDDGVQQRLTSLVVGLRSVQHLLPDGPAEALELLDQSIEEAQEAIEDLRRLAAGIHPPALITRGLTAAVQGLAVRSPIPAEVVSNSERRLPGAIESSAYFLIAESLTNAVKHAKADRIAITLCFGTDLEIVVTDDGVGGIPDTTVGSGLVGLRDRVAAFGGELSIDSQIGHGTRVAARIPIPETATT
jgi:signal transduction histidine kinase